MEANKLAFSARDLQQMSDSESFERAQKYFFENRVRNLYQQGNRFRGIVQGSNRYTVNFWQNPLSAWCNCPYSGPGACKHILVTGMALLAGSPEIVVWPRVDFAAPELALPFLYISQINPQQVKQDLLNGKQNPHQWEQAFNAYRKSRHGLELLDLLMAWFEAFPEQMSTIEYYWSDFLRDKHPAPVLAREMLSHFFDRWYESERQRESGGANNPYQISQWSAILLSLISSPLAAQFCRIRLEGYGLYGGQWRELWAKIEEY